MHTYGGFARAHLKRYGFVREFRLKRAHQGTMHRAPTNTLRDYVLLLRDEALESLGPIP